MTKRRITEPHVHVEDEHDGHDHDGHGHEKADDEAARALEAERVRQAHAGHDHGKHDAARHDHTGHDENHQPRDEHDHDHGDGDGHDHGGHSHAKTTRSPRAPQKRPAENGGSALQLAIEDLVPEGGETGTVDRIQKALEAHRGVAKVHLRVDSGHAELCIHHDDNVSVAQLLEFACRHGAVCMDRFERMTWFVHGLESADSAAPLETMLLGIPGVLAADVAYAAERVVVEFDIDTTSAEAIAKRARELGYELEVPEAGKACSMHAHEGGLGPRLQMPLALGAGALLGLGYSLEKIAPSCLPAQTSVALYIVALIAAAIFPLRAAVKAIRAKQVDVETLMILAGVGAAVLGAWFEGAFLLFLFTLGHALEHRAMERARKTIESLGELTAKTARVKRGDQIVELDLKQVTLGERVVVRAGDRIPLDGVIREGKSLVDQATITGESVPVARGPGDKVFAGTINTDAALEVEVTNLAGDTLLARIVDMVTEAEAQKSATQRFVQRLEKRFVPLVLVIAAIVPVVLVLTGTPWQSAILRGVSLIVAASPCALAISTPSAVLAAVARAAKGGVLIKGGAHLESLGRVRAIAFDKTGTLTHGKPQLVSIEAADGVDESDLLATAAGLEALSSHPIAKAIIAGAAERGITSPPAAQGDAIHGKGIQGRVAGKEVQIGNLAMFAGGPVPDSITRAAAALEEKGQTTMIVAREGAFLGVLGVADTVREEASPALKQLDELGVQTTIMLSGDNERVARSIASSVGIKEVRAPLLPDGKVAEIRNLAKGPGGVAMVGDGVNDAPALAAASVGIAMGGTAADATLETADIVLLDDSLTRLPFAVGLARRASSVIRQNVIISLGVSSLLIVGSVFGWASIAQAVVLHEGSTLIVVGNALLLLRYPLKRS